MKLRRIETIARVNGSRTVALQHRCQRCRYVYHSAKPETLLTDYEWTRWMGKKRPRLLTRSGGYGG
jgi:hypothetical protein